MLMILINVNDIKLKRNFKKNLSINFIKIYQNGTTAYVYFYPFSRYSTKVRTTKKVFRVIPCLLRVCGK